MDPSSLSALILSLHSSPSPLPFTPLDPSLPPPQHQPKNKKEEKEEEENKEWGGGGGEERKERKGGVWVFDSSNNPPHCGHCEMVVRVGLELCPSVVVLLFSFKNAQKDMSRISAKNLENRVMMMHYLRESIITRMSEVAPSQPQPKIICGVTSQSLFKDKTEGILNYFNHSFDKVNYIVGFDTLVRIFDQKYYQNYEESLKCLFNQSDFAFFSSRRPGAVTEAYFSSEQEQLFFENLYVKPYTSQLHHLPIPSFYSSLSSSLVRQQFEKLSSATNEEEKSKLKEEIEKMVPLAILSFLYKNNLY